MLIWVIQFILPESRQVPLERMNELFAPGVKPWKAHAIVMSRTRDERMADEGSVDQVASLSDLDRKIDEVNVEEYRGA